MEIRYGKNKKLLAIFIVLILFFMISYVFLNSWQGFKANADVIGSGSADFIDNDLLLVDYTQRKDGMVFNGKALDDLYTKLIGSSDFALLEKQAKTTKVSGKNAYLIHSGMDSQDIRGKNKGRNIVVKLGGMDWIVTSLTSSSSNEVVLTLWLADTAYQDQFNTWKNEGVSDTYPSSMYATSYIRAALLDGIDSNGADAKYVKSLGDSTLSEYVRPNGFNYLFDIFTKPITSNRANGSIVDFIVK